MSWLDKVLGLTTSHVPPRTAEEQAVADSKVAGLSLYHFDSCPFCLRVRRVISKLGLEIPLRNIHQDPAHLEELVREGGSQQVPCLRIEGEDGEVTWLYESGDITRWLEEQFAPT